VSDAAAPQPRFDPSQPFTREGKSSGAPPPRFDPAKPFTREAAKPEQGIGESLWEGLKRFGSGMSGGDGSRAGQFGMGVADPAVGMMQMGARGVTDPPPIAYTEQQAKAVDPERQAEQARAVDTSVQQREARFEQSEKAAGQSGGLWARLLGNVVGSSPLAAIPGGAALRAGGALAKGLGMVGRGMLTGTAAGVAEPVTGGDFATEKAKQAGLGAAGGAIAGPVAEVAGSALGRAIAGNTPQAVDEAMNKSFRTIVKPGRGGRGSESALNTQDRQILTAVDNIIANKPNLQLTDAAGAAVKGALPRTLRQFSEAIDQTKRGVFSKYDAMAHSAESAVSEAPNRHLAEFTQASRRAAEAQQAVSRAQQAVTLATAKQSRAGNNVYSSSAANEANQQANANLERARAALDAAQRGKAAAKTKAYSVRVDTGSAAKQLRAAASDRVVADFHPEIANKANQLARNLESEGSLTLTEAQDLIQMINKEARGFYQNGQSGLGEKLAPVATTLRAQLDHAIESAGSPGYQALKLQYGALRSIEKDVAGAVQREANKVPGGIGGVFLDALATEEAMRGIFNPAALVRAGGAKAAKAALKYINDPNRAIERLFTRRASSMGAPPPGPVRQGIGSAVSGASPIGAVAGGDAAAPRGPAGGRIIEQRSIQRPASGYPSP
jgi:hypothetical protein